MRAFIGCDTLGYLSLEGMLASVAQPAAHCTACFRGDYLVPPVDTANRNHRPLRILDSGDS